MKRFLLLYACLAAPAAHAEQLWPDISAATEDGAYSIAFHGRYVADIGTGSGDGDAILRRSRAFVSGKIAQDFFYKIENDFSADNFPDGITDAFAGYDVNEGLFIQAGQFKEPFNLETVTTSRFGTFMERSLTTAFAPTRRVGAMAAGRGVEGDHAWTLSAGYFNGGIGVSDSEDDTRDITARGTWAHIENPANILHAGLAASHRTPDNPNDQISFSTTPESRFNGGDAADTGAIIGVDHALQWGLEGAGVWGPFSLQSELMHVDVQRHAAADAAFTGYYLQASYYLTGEHRHYVANRGMFGRVSPLHPVTEGGWGAWQLAARYSAIDLTNGGINGGELDDLTLGLNWIPHKQVVVMGNIVMANNDDSGPTPLDDPTFFTLRVQYDF